MKPPRLDQVFEALFAALALATALWIVAHYTPRTSLKSPPAVWHWAGCWWHVTARPFSQDEKDFDCAV